MPRYSVSAFGKSIPIAETDQPLSKTVGRRLASQADTLIDSGGTVNSYEFEGQDITRDDLREVKQIRETGGVISMLMRQKALLNFGNGASWQVPGNEATTQTIDGREMTLKDYLQTTFPEIDSLLLDVGEDALWYPYGAVETVENRAGRFSHIEPVEPWTILPQTDQHGDIVRWEQEISDRTAKTYDADDITHFPLNKSSARDKTGISAVLRSKEEIERFRQNQMAIKSAIELHAFPQRHVKVGREGSAPIRDNELRRVRTLFDSRTTDSDTVYVTGQDVEIEALEAENFDFEKVSEDDMRQLSLALGIPLELTNYGKDGLGSGKPAELRMDLFKLQVKANQRRFANIWVEDVIRPILKQYSPFNHTRDIHLELADPISDEQEVADLIEKVGDQMTNEQVAEKLGIEPPEDEDIAQSYRTPAEIEKPDESGGGTDSLFSDKAEQTVTEELEQKELADIPEKYLDGTGLSEDDFVPNQDVQDTVKQVLDFIDERGLPNPDNQQEGATRANQLYDHAVDNNPLAVKFWEEIKNFHARHRAQDNHVCDESSLPEEADEIDQSKHDACFFDPGYFSDQTWGGDAALEQAERIVGAIEDTDGVELSGGMDFSHTPDWDRHLVTMHQQIHEDGTRNLLQFTDSQVPEFVESRIRDTIMSGTLFKDIDSINSDDRMQLREFLSESLTSDGWTIDGVADKIEQLGVNSANAETIARTETASIVNSAREDGYRERGQEGDRFYWTGATDSRTTDACEWLLNKTNPFKGGDPVTMDRLKELIEEAPTHDDDMQNDLARPEQFVVHPNERKTFARAPPDV